MKHITLLSIFMISSSALANMYTVEFKEASVEAILLTYAETTGKRIDLVKGEHKPITLVFDKVSKEFLLEQIGISLEKQNLKLYKISDDHLVASWIEVPESKIKKAMPVRKKNYQYQTEVTRKGVAPLPKKDEN